VRTPLNTEIALKAIQAAGDAIAGTDGIVLCVVAVRIGEDGTPEVFTPTISPDRIPTKVVAGIVTAYAESLQSLGGKALQNGGVSRERISVNIRPSVNPLHTHRPGRGKHTVN
jgi:hypothetical protein